MHAIYVLAQAAAAAVPAAVPVQPQGVISYPASFFADKQVANAYEMLNRIPGFSLDTGDSVRGFEGAAGNVLIDGQRPTSKADTVDQKLQRIPTAQVERIDIIRGGAPGIDMQGKSVLANVIRKPGSSFHGLFQVTDEHLWDDRDMHGMRLELSGGDGERTWEAQARYGYGNDDGGSDGPQLRIAPDGAIIRRSVVRSESDGLQQILYGAYSQPLLGGRISLNARGFWDSWKSEETNRYLEPASLGVAREVNPYDKFETELGARYGRNFGQATRLELVGLRTDKHYHAFDVFEFQGDKSDFRNRRRQSETIGRGVLKHQASRRLSFEAGGEFAFNKLDSRSVDFENGVQALLPAANVQVEEKRGEAFAKATWRPADRWTVDGSVRYETSRISSSGDVALAKRLTFLKPRLAVSWDPLPATELRVRFEREVGQLDFDDFVASTNFNIGQGVSAGNPDLNPQQAYVAEVALEQRWMGADATLTFRHSELKDAIDRGPVFVPELDPQGRPVLDADGQPVVGIFDQPTNIGDGTKDELIFELTAPTAQWGWKGGLFKAEVNKRWSKVTDPTTHARRPISGLRPLEWNVHYSQDLPRGVSLGADYYSGWSEKSYFFNYTQDVKLHNAYLVLWVEKRLRPDLEVRLEAQNITSRGIRILTEVYAPTRLGALRYTDDRNLIPGTSYYIRIRKTFGS
jgi:outer membrane receptor protein involved in Fe transport